MEPTLDPILRPKHPNRSQDDTKRPLRCIKKPKATMFKNLKKLVFFQVFGYRYLSKEAQETQESTQKAPKEYQDPKRKDPTLKPKTTIFWRQLGSHF